MKITKSHAENLPYELQTPARFFSVIVDKDGKKIPLGKDWCNPKNQMSATTAAITQYAGFDISGHDIRDDYALLDFDHVLDETTGEFVNADAERWFNFIQSSFDDGYAELSVSGTGIHVFLKPTPGKFDKITNSKGKGVLYFDEPNNIKLEIFYKNAARYCLVTGEPFRCEKCTPIASGEIADEILNTFLAAICPPSSTNTETKTHTARADLPNADAPEYDLFRAERMLDVIRPAELGDSDWLAVQSAAKNIGVSYAVLDAFNRRDEKRYSSEENQSRYDSLKDPSFGIETLHGIAKRFGYSEKDSQREWYKLHPNTNPDFDDPEVEAAFRAHVMELAGRDAELKKKVLEQPKKQDAEIYMQGLTEDLDNARRLVKFCGDRTKWLTDSECWLIWNQKGVWEKHSEKNSCLAPFVADFADLMMSHAKILAETQNRLFQEYLKASAGKDGTIKTDADPAQKSAKEKADKAKDRADKAFTIAYSFRKAKKVSPAISMMKGESSILITQDDLDNHAELLNCLNGVVDLQTGKRYPAAPKLLLTQQCRAAYEPNAQSELVDKFFRDIMPDEETRAGLLRWLGYCLTGEVIEEKFMVWTGDGGNGKGVLGGTLIELTGDYGTGLTPRALLKNRNDRDADKATTALNSIELARFALSEELPADAELDCSLVKNLTGGDRINLRRNYGEYRTIKPTAKINISGNYTPRLENVFDGGILRRLLNMPFTVRFGTAANPADPHLKKKLLLPENLSALFAALVRESVAWYRGDGLIISPLMKDATDKHLSQNDFVADFIADNYVFVPTASVKAKDFIEHLRREYPRECARFKRADLIELIAKVDGVTYGDDRAHCRVFKGIGKLANVDDFDGEPVGNDIATP